MVVKFVAVGSGLATSEDAATWTARDVGGAGLNGVTHANGLWVAVGGNGAVLTSPDGVTWTRRTVGLGTTANFIGVVYDDERGRWLALAESGSTAVSTNGTTWDDGRAGPSGMINVAYASGMHVAVTGTTVYTSPDGENWTQRAQNNEYTLRDVATNGTGRWVVSNVGGHRTVLVSTDNGTTWAAHPFGSGSQGVVYGQGRFVALGERVYRLSEDGVTWVDAATVTGSVGQLMSGALGYGYGLFIHGTGGFRTSADGSTWTSQRTWPLTYASDIAAASNLPPDAPTLTFPVDEAIPTTQPNRFMVGFRDTDPDDRMSALRIWARPAGTTTWTIDTGWVTTPSPFHDFPAGTFTVGDWEWQAATKDSRGVAGPASPSAFFTAATPPPGPSITDPVNNGTIPTNTYTVVWSTPDQDAYQVQVLDGGTILTDTGVVESPTARSRALDFPDNQVGRTIRVRIRDGGLWSEWATVTVTVSYTPPATPVLSVGPHRPGEVDGLRVQVTHPAPVGDQPTVTSHDVYVREVGDTGPGIRIGADLPATVAWEPGPGQPWLPASGVDYAFRVRAVGSSGTTSWSAWTE